MLLLWSNRLSGLLTNRIIKYRAIKQNVHIAVSGSLGFISVRYGKPWQYGVRVGEYDHRLQCISTMTHSNFKHYNAFIKTDAIYTVVNSTEVTQLNITN